MNDFEIYVTSSREAIQAEIAAAFNSLQPVIPELKTEYTLFAESAQGGKNIRGVLVQLGYVLANPLKNNEIWKVAAAFEILHASLLIHDDIIDRSRMRRGKPTVHKALGGEHYGISQAICLGDMGFFLATQLIAESTFPSETKAEVIALFSQMVMDTIAGEILDVKISLPDYPKKGADIMTMQRLKTASYTIVGPLTVGAMLGGADVKKLRVIKDFGELIGMAFQIQDDILGVFGDEKQIGKSATSDIEENKSTLLIVHALKKATPAQKKILLKYYGKGKISLSNHKKIKKIFEDTDSLAYSQAKVTEYVNAGKKFIPHITEDKNTQTILTQFAEFIFQRKT